MYLPIKKTFSVFPFSLCLSLSRFMSCHNMLYFGRFPEKIRPWFQLVDTVYIHTGRWFDTVQAGILSCVVFCMLHSKWKTWAHWTINHAPIKFIPCISFTRGKEEMWIILAHNGGIEVAVNESEPSQWIFRSNTMYNMQRSLTLTRTAFVKGEYQWIGWTNMLNIFNKIHEKKLPLIRWNIAPQLNPSKYYAVATRGRLAGIVRWTKALLQKFNPSIWPKWKDWFCEVL